MADREPKMGENVGFVRLLRASEIECRVASVNAKGVTLLLYKDARVDQRILDETFGPFGWRRSHQCIDGKLFCSVEIYDSEKKEWIMKQDVGTTGYAEKEKSQASDSFKRACFNWGVGRELYSAPFIWISAEKVEIARRGESFICNTRFQVTSITYNNDREIIGLQICSNKGVVVYELKPVEQEQLPQKKKVKGITKAQLKKLDEELQRTGVSIMEVQERYKVTELGDMSAETYQHLMVALKKTKSAA